jgi:hypothetical protein
MSARQHTEGLVSGLPKDYRPLVRAALANGWKLQRTGKGHAKLTSPTGWSTPLPGTSKNPSLFKAIRKRLAEHGVPIAA